MLVLDANILVRTVLGRRVRMLVTGYGNRVEFLAPDIAFAEVREHLPRILPKRAIAVPGGSGSTSSVLAMRCAIWTEDIDAKSALE